MNRLLLFRLLRRNNKLSFRRSPAFEQSMVGKVMAVIGGGFMIIYLIFFGVMFSVIANEGDAPGLLLVIMPLLMLLDFGIRFAFQQTPAMLVKPYLLLPMPRKAVIENFLISSVFSGYNFLWLCMLLPYSFIVWAGGASLLSMLALLLSGMLLVMINSQWYLLIRTLVARSLLWWVVPVVAYAFYFVPMYFDDKWKVFDKVSDFVGENGASWLVTALCFLTLLVFVWFNRWLQFRYVLEEVSNEQKAPAALKNVSQFTFLERFGEIGEYLKLEMKSILRNKAIRSRVLMSLGLVVMLSLIITFSDMYNGFMMLNFWCYYCFGIYSMTTLVKIMSPEGNYIDLLMVHRENILSLLKAKYYFHVGVLIVPFLLMLPAVFAGKFSILMMLAYMFLSSGLLYFILFQLAVYNKQTLPLDQKMTGKNNMENGLQLLLEMVGMFLPIVLVALFLLLFSETVAYLLLIGIGLVFTVLHPLWLRNVYVRMMSRKYENLEGFHASR